MNKRRALLTLFIALLSLGLHSQTKLGGNAKGQPIEGSDGSAPNGINNDSKDSKDGLAKQDYRDYLILSQSNDTIIIDTTLTLDHEYKFNWTRKDKFGYMEFANQGKTYTPLQADFESISLSPLMGVPAKEYNYYQAEDIKYFNVPTPTSEAAYRNGIGQGQFLDVFFTSNFSEQFNASISYKGLRSLGEYRYSLSSNTNLRIATNYHSKGGHYQLKTHYVQQDLFNEENGGLTDYSMEMFQTNNPNFQDRGRLEVNLNDASSQLDGKRIYINQSYQFFSPKKDSITRRMSNLSLDHELKYEWKKFSFDQETIYSDNIFGQAYTAAVEDRTWLETLDNDLGLNFQSPYLLGDFKVYAHLQNYNYSFNTLTVEQDGTILPNHISGDLLSLGAKWNAQVGKMHLDAKAEGIISGNQNGNTINGQIYFQQDSISTYGARLNLSSKAPDFNYQLYQSDYKNFNWYNSNLNNENYRSLAVFLNNKFANIEASYNQVDNFTYFENNENPEVKQLTGATVNYLKIKFENEFKFGKFALRNTMLYQNVFEGQEAFRVPEFVTRNTLYFSSYVFKGKPMFLQTGVHFNYFSKHYANAFNPVLGSYVVQNDQQIGNYPVLDYFINAQVRRTRIFFKIENFTSSLLEPNYFASPLYPYRDWKIRFGIIWTWFN